MQHDATIKASAERLVSTLKARPSFGLETTLTRADMRDGFTTTCREGDVELIADMPAGLGGTRSGPTPGVFGRACIASCIAMGIRLAAERRGINLGEVTVELSMDWDARGLFELGEIAPGPSNIGLNVTLVSDAEASDLQGIVDAGLCTSPWIVALTRPHTITTELSIVKGA